MDKIKVPFSAQLCEFDTENQTKGCRANNPDICGNNSVQGICAYVCKDGICRKPSRVWKKQYENLKNNQ